MNYLQRVRLSYILHPSDCPESAVNIRSLRRRSSYRALGFFFGPSRLAAAHVDSLPATGIHRILICRITHSLGNTLLLTPLIREIQAVYPGAEIDLLTRTAAAGDIFSAFFSVRCVHRLPAHAFRHPLKFLGIVRRIRSTHYDLVIDPCPESQTGRLTLLFAMGRYKLGFSGRKKMGTLTHSVDVPKDPRQVGQLPVFLLRSALGTISPRPYPPMDLALSPSERQRGIDALALLASSDINTPSSRGVIGVFANATGPKLLNDEWWREFMQELEARHAGHAIVEIVPMFGKSLLGDRYPAYFSSDIRKLASVLSALSLFISADCGVMHLACASGAPVAGIFTVTDADEWGPYGPNDDAVHAHGIPPKQVAEQIAQRYLTPLVPSG